MQLYPFKLIGLQLLILLAALVVNGILVNNGWLKNLLYRLIPATFLVILIPLLRFEFFVSSKQSSAQISFDLLESMPLAFEANKLNLAFCLLIGIFWLGLAFCLESEEKQQKIDHSKLAKNSTICSFALLLILALGKSFAVYLIVEFGFMLIAQNFFLRWMAKKPSQSSNIFFLFYLQSFLLFLAAVLLHKFNGLNDFSGDQFHFLLSNQKAWIVVFGLVLGGLFMFSTLPFWLFLKKNNLGLEKNFLSFISTILLAKLIIATKIFTSLAHVFSLREAMEESGFRIFELVLLTNLLVLSISMLLSKKLNSIILYLAFHQFTFLLFEFLEIFDDERNLEFMAIVGVSCCFGIIFFCVNNFKNYFLKNSADLNLRTYSKSRFGEPDMQYFLESEAKLIKTYDERGSTQNAEEIANKGRDFEQVLNKSDSELFSKDSNQLTGLFSFLPISCTLFLIALFSLAGLFPGSIMLEKFQLLKVILKQKSLFGFLVFALNFLSLMALAIKFLWQFFRQNKPNENLQINRQIKTKFEEELEGNFYIFSPAALLLTCFLGIFFFSFLSKFN